MVVTVKCKATTKKGEPCKSPPIKGTDRCLSHSSAKARESVGFVADNGKAGRKPLPKPTDVARQLIERHIEVTLAPHFRTLGYEITRNDDDELDIVASDGGGAKLYGESKEGYIEVSSHDDLGAMIAAAEKLLDRIYGRPKQATEITGADGGPVQTQELIPSDASWHEQVAGVLDEAEALTASSSNGAGPHKA